MTVSEGPWTFKGDPYIGLKILDAAGFCIAVVNGDVTLLEDDLSNAKLIIRAPDMQQELEQLRAERNGRAITLATQRHVAELEAENERLQRTLHMVDNWLAETLPGSSSEAIRALIAEALQGKKPAQGAFYSAQGKMIP